MEKIFFDTWDGLFRIAITTIVAYLLIILILRISGKRTLAKMNAFDFVVTIALGSILGAVILNKNIPLTEGLLALILLISLQYLFTFLSVRNEKFKKLISSSPTLVFYNDQILHHILKKERITVNELHKSVREAGFSNFEKIAAIVLEPTGDITVISKESSGDDKTALKDADNF